MSLSKKTNPIGSKKTSFNFDFHPVLIKPISKKDEQPKNTATSLPIENALRIYREALESQEQNKFVLCKKCCSPIRLGSSNCHHCASKKLIEMGVSSYLMTEYRNAVMSNKENAYKSIEALIMLLLRNRKN